MENIIEVYGDTIITVIGIAAGVLLLGQCWAAYQEEIKHLISMVLFR